MPTVNKYHRFKPRQMLVRSQKGYLYGNAAQILPAPSMARISACVRFETDEKGWDFLTRLNRS